MKSPCNVLKGTSIVMANTVMLSCASCVEAVRAPHCVQLLCLLTKTSADFLYYAFGTGMCRSHVLCNLPCESYHGSGVQKHVCGNIA
jgi:hypothetical protein